MYLFLLTIHIFAVTIFLGNIITTLVWKVHAEKTRNPVFINHTVSIALATDKTITVPSVIVITFSGILLLYYRSIHIFDFSWLLISIILWLISAIAAIFYLVPLLKRLYELSKGQKKLSDAYFNLTKRWNMASIILILNPIIILILMVIKLPN